MLASSSPALALPSAVKRNYFLSMHREVYSNQEEPSQKDGANERFAVDSLQFERVLRSRQTESLVKARECWNESVQAEPINGKIENTLVKQIRAIKLIVCRIQARTVRKVRMHLQMEAVYFLTVWY